jgi:hypothetical protein
VLLDNRKDIWWSEITGEIRYVIPTNYRRRAMSFLSDAQIVVEALEK